MFHTSVYILLMNWPTIIDQFSILISYCFPTKTAHLSVAFNTVNTRWHYLPLIVRPNRVLILHDACVEYRSLCWMTSTHRTIFLDTVIDYVKRNRQLGVTYKPQGWLLTYELLNSWGYIDIARDLDRIYVLRRREAFREPFYVDPEFVGAES